MNYSYSIAQNTIFSITYLPLYPDFFKNFEKTLDAVWTKRV